MCATLEKGHEGLFTRAESAPAGRRAEARRQSSGTPFEALGGAKGLKKLVTVFYRRMSETPEAATIRAMHPADISTSEEKLYFFLSGWTGGPRLFDEKFGHPMLRRRHLPFAIGESERDQWMLCMERAMHEVGVREPLFSQLYVAFHDLADHMRNDER